MYGIDQNDIVSIEKKIQSQKEYLTNFSLDFLNDGFSLLDNTYSANLNPKKYFAEINNRVNTMFTNAKEKGLKPVFVTLTAPSFYHMKNKDGSLAIDPNTTAKELTQIWNKFTNLRVFQKMKKELGHGLIYFRVYEPHKSGVPHLHAMIFIPCSYILEVKRKYKEYFSSEKWGANKKAIDFKYTWYKQSGGAIGYIMKYITKTFKDEENTKAIQYASYWYIKHKVRRFLSSRTLAPLTVYRKVRYYFKSHHSNDYQSVTNKLENGVIKKSFDNTLISYIYYDHENGEVSEKILWGKNTDLVLNKRQDQEFEKLKQQREKKQLQEIKEYRKQKSKELKKDIEIFRHKGNIYTYSQKQGKFVKRVVIPSRLNNYQLVQYFYKLDEMPLDELNIQHYLLTKNEMIKRGLLKGEISTLNEIF